MASFDNKQIKLDVLKKRAYNYRWAEVDEGVIPLTAADPDYPVAPEIQEAMIDYIKDGYFSYTPKLGYPEFSESISRGLKARKGEEIRPELILPIDSAARGMYVIAESVLKPGDEMIVFDPVDYLFRESCLAAGGKPVFFPAKLNSTGYLVEILVQVVYCQLIGCLRHQMLNGFHHLAEQFVANALDDYQNGVGMVLLELLGIGIELEAAFLSRFQDGLFFVLFVLFHLDLLLLRQTSSTILSNTKVETVFYIASLLAFINVKPL